MTGQEAIGRQMGDAAARAGKVEMRAEFEGLGGDYAKGFREAFDARIPPRKRHPWE